MKKSNKCHSNKMPYHIFVFELFSSLNEIRGRIRELEIKPDNNLERIENLKITRDCLLKSLFEKWSK